MPAGDKSHNNALLDPNDDYYFYDESTYKEVGYVPLPRPSGPISRYFRTELVWRNIILISLLHVFAMCGLAIGPSAKLGTWGMYMWIIVVCGFSVTGGAHRLWAHKSYKAHWLYRLVLMLLQTAAFQNHVIEWARDHRTHHKFSETDADPHNANRGFFFAHMGWLMCRKHPEVIKKGKLVDMSDLENDPILAFQKKYYLLIVPFMTFLIPTFLTSYLTGDTPLNCFLICGMLRYVFTLHITWLVNSAAHLWGSRPYDKEMQPAENIFVSIAAIGEGFHNYHHCFPYDYTTSEFGISCNATSCIIDIAAALGLVWDRKRANPDSIQARKTRTGEYS